VDHARAIEERPVARHTPEHIARLRIHRDFDGDTPYYEGIETYAAAPRPRAWRRSKQGAPVKPPSA